MTNPRTLIRTGPPKGVTSREQKTAQPHADERKTGINAHLEEQMQRHLAEAEAIRQEAYNAAQTGTGPQPWDRDWYRNKETTHWSFYSDLLEEFEWGWHQTNDLIEVFSWALASPDAQRAVMGIGEPNSPDQNALNLLHQFLLALKNHRSTMLSMDLSQAELPIALHERLEKRLAEGLNREPWEEQGSG